MSVATLRAARAALASAPRWQRRRRLTELMAAATDLADLVARYETHLNAEHVALLAIETDGLAAADSAVVARQEKWMANLTTYETARTALGDALAVVKGETA